MALANSNLSVTLYFDLDNNRLRIQDDTNYTGATPAIAEADIRGVYTLTDPNSNILYQNADYDNPDVATSIDADLYSAYKSFTVAVGAYTLVYNVKDVNTSTTYTKTFTFTYATSYIPTVVIGIESNVGLATIESTDETSYDATITLNTRTHTLTYPSTWGSTTETSTTIDTIALTELYTGQYSATITSAITRTGTDNLVINKSITGTQTHNVWDTDGMYAVRAALNTFYDRWQDNQTADPKEGRRERDLWIEINANYALYNSYKQNGDIANAGEYLNNIKTILSAEDIDTTIDPSVSVPVTSTIPGYATRWLQDAGAPSASTGRNGDYYINTSTNEYYLKDSGSWGTKIGTLGANTLIEFSDTGGSSSVSWSATYSNGYNYIRLSGDGGSTYTNPAKFIDGYVYYAYASDASGTDFICNDDPTFTFNPVLEYIAIKKFQVSHNGDLVAGDFSGLFTKYRDNGIIAYCTTPSVSIPTDADGNNPVFPSTNPQVVVYDGDTDVTSNWTITINTATNVTASIVNDNEVDITSISANLGSILIDCDRSGYDTLQVLIGVHKTKAGQAIVDGTSVDDVTIGLNGSSKLYIKDSAVDTAQIADGAVDTAQIADDAVTLDKIETISLSEINRTLVKISDSTGVLEDVIIDGFGDGGVAWIESNRMAVIYEDDYQSLGSFNTLHLQTLQYSNDTWSLIGDKLDLVLGSTQLIGVENLGKNRVVVASMPIQVETYLTTYVFNGTTWSQQGNSLLFDNSVDNMYIHDIAELDDENIIIAFQDYTVGNEFTLRKYNWDGTDWTQVGNDYTFTYGSNELVITAYNDSNILMWYYPSGASDYYLGKLSFDGTDFSLDFSEELGIDIGNKALLKFISEDEFFISYENSTNIYNWKIINEKFYNLGIVGSSRNRLINMTIMPNGYIAVKSINPSTQEGEPIDLYFRFKFN